MRIRLSSHFWLIVLGFALLFVVLGLSSLLPRGVTASSDSYGYEGYKSLREIEYRRKTVGPAQVFATLGKRCRDKTYDAQLPLARKLLAAASTAVEKMDDKELRAVRQQLEDFIVFRGDTGVDWVQLELDVFAALEVKPDEIPDFIEKVANERPDTWIAYRERMLAQTEALRLDAFGQFLREWKNRKNISGEEQDALVLMKLWYLSARLDALRMKQSEWFRQYVKKELVEIGVP